MSALDLVAYVFGIFALVGLGVRYNKMRRRTLELEEQQSRMLSHLRRSGSAAEPRASAARLSIPGTRRVAPCPRVVQACGLGREDLVDSCYFAAEEETPVFLAPPKVQLALASIQDLGSTRGWELAQFLEDERALLPGEAIWFFLVATGGRSDEWHAVATIGSAPVRTVGRE